MSWSLKEAEMNRIVAVLHLGTILMTCMALAQSGWFHIKGLQCSPHIGLSQFFGFGEFTTETISPVRHFKIGNIEAVMAPPIAISYLYTSSATLVCVSPRLANLMKIIILLCFMVIIFSAVGIFLNLVNLKNEMLKIIQRNAILNMFCVLWIVAIVGICYYVTLLIQDETSSGDMPNINISYEYGFYTITAAGVISIMGAAASLLSSSLFSTNIRHSGLLDSHGNFRPITRRVNNMRNLVIVNTTASGFMARRNRPFQPRPPSTRRLLEINSPESDLTMLTSPPPYTP